MATYLLEHPAALLPNRSPEHRDIMHTDFRRIVRLMSGYRPQYLDDFRIIGSPQVSRAETGEPAAVLAGPCQGSMSDIGRTGKQSGLWASSFNPDDDLAAWIASAPGRIALDLETLPNGTIDMVGFSRSATEARLLRLPDPHRLDGILTVLRNHEIVVHYGEGIELDWFHTVTGGNCPTIHDLHKLFHAWDPEYAASGGSDAEKSSRKGGSGALAFIQSLYSWRPYHKYLLKKCYDRATLVNPILKAHYCMLDCVVTWECFHRIEEVCHAEAPACWEAYLRDAVPLLPIMVQSRREGWLVDREKFDDRRAALRVESRAAAEAVIAHYGLSIAPKSKKAKTPISLHGLKRVLTDAGIKLPETDKGNPQLDKKARSRLFIRHPEFADLERYLSLQDTLGDCYDPKIIAGDGRCHPTWSGYEKAWRWRCTGPNLQQRPPSERPVFVADAGYDLAIFDLDVAEYRWFAGETGDPDLLHAFAEYDAGRAPKPHVGNAAILFQTSVSDAETWQSEQSPLHGRYVFSKNFIYGGILYSYTGGVQQLADAAAKVGLTIKLSEIKKMRLQWLQRYPRAARCREEWVAEARQTRYVLCREWGYGRRLHGLDIENEALNYRMQAGVAGIINRTICEVYDEFHIVPLANMHDGIVYQIQRAPWFDSWVRYIKAKLERPLRTLDSLRIPAEVSVGHAWGETILWTP